LKAGSKVTFKDDTFIVAFNKLKQLIINDPILIYPDFEKSFQLTTDASNFELGVLSQDNKPISYISRTQNAHEENYSTIEKQLLAIVWATKTLRSYLFVR